MTMNTLFADYTNLGGNKKLSSFKNKAALIAAIDAMTPATKLTKVERARLRRLAAANGIVRERGSRWTATMIASIPA